MKQYQVNQLLNSTAKNRNGIMRLDTLAVILLGLSIIGITFVNIAQTEYIKNLESRIETLEADFDSIQGFTLELGWMNDEQNERLDILSEKVEGTNAVFSMFQDDLGLLTINVEDLKRIVNCK